MSDNYIIVCPKSIVEDPELKARQVLTWLQSNNVVEKTLSDSVIGGSGKGYRPAKNHLSILKHEFEGDYITNGLDVRVGTQVFDQVEIDAKIICPKCNDDQFREITPAEFYGETLSRELKDVYSTFCGALYNYNDQKDIGLACHHCGASSVISDYTIENVCFSNVGLVFWNWPELRDVTIVEIEKIWQTEVIVKVGNM